MSLPYKTVIYFLTEVSTFLGCYLSLRVVKLLRFIKCHKESATFKGSWRTSKCAVKVLRVANLFRAFCALSWSCQPVQGVLCLVTELPTCSGRSLLCHGVANLFRAFSALSWSCQPVQGVLCLVLELPTCSGRSLPCHGVANPCGKFHPSQLVPAF